MGKLFANGARIRRNNEQERVDALLADAERLLIELFSEENAPANSRRNHRGQTALRHIASARLANDPTFRCTRRSPL